MEFNQTNKYQTKLTEELIEALPKGVYADLIDLLESIPYVNKLIQPEEIRGFAKDRPKIKVRGVEDPRGRIQVDLTNPHILEDMDYFRPAAIHFEKHGVYTSIKRSANPKSEYARFWAREQARWRHGYARKSDGEWIPGWYYFYLNYSPIAIVKGEEDETFDEWLERIKDPGKKGAKKKGERITAFPKVYAGDYLYFHYLDQAQEYGLHAVFLKCRGIGFSFKSAAMSPRNMYVYTGSKNTCFHLASEKSFLAGDQGLFGKVMDVLDHIGEHTPLPRMRLVDSKQQMTIQLGFVDEYGARKGLKSTVSGISLKDNPDKARGIRGSLIAYEEMGLFRGLEKAWNVNLKAAEEGNTGFCLMLAGGTGGTTGAAWAGAEKLFYNPKGYSIYGIPNIYDRGVNGSSDCGFFWPAYMNRRGCFDPETGESDIIKALIEVLTDRWYIKNNSPDPTALTQRMAEEPIVPQEAVLRVEGTLFPAGDIKERLAQILPSRESFLSSHYIGELVFEGPGKVKWSNAPDINILREFPIKNNINKEGGVEIFKVPYKTQEGNVPSRRYIAGMDPIDDDSSTTNSLFSMFVWDLLLDEPVAEYTGRASTAEASYIIAHKLLIYYNAICNYEADKKGFYAYMKNNYSLHMLCDTLDSLKRTDLVKSNLTGNKSKGTNSGKAINQHARRLQADWLVSTYTVPNEEDDLMGTTIEYLQWACYFY